MIYLSITQLGAATFRSAFRAWWCYTYWREQSNKFERTTVLGHMWLPPLKKQGDKLNNLCTVYLASDVRAMPVGKGNYCKGAHRMTTCNSCASLGSEKEDNTGKWNSLKICAYLKLQCGVISGDMEPQLLLVYWDVYSIFHPKSDSQPLIKSLYHLLLEWHTNKSTSNCFSGI